tara:strand:+ start:16496 stop:17470 length:975 start_codon:yes stop_codon:yes gene_type:complete
MRRTDMSEKFSEFFLDDPWKNMSEPNYPNGSRLYKNSWDFWVSINAEEELVFFVKTEGIFNIKKLPKLRNLSMSVDHFDNETRLVCALTDITLRDKFSLIAKKVAFKNAEYEGQQLILESLNEIQEWGNFLKPTRVGLTHEEYLGFWGELYVLSELLSPILGLGDALRFWIGPQGKKQDFTLNDLAIETKTTLSGDSNLIKISSYEQLQKITKKLYLLRMQINKTESTDGFSLKSMYEKVKSLCDKDQESELIDKTKNLYNKASEAQLDEKCDCLRYYIYDVNDNFPKIIKEKLDQAITAVKYSINPNSLNDFEVKKTIAELLE